jgi:hypothetical protein
MTAEQIIDAIRLLPIEERYRLVERLMSELSPRDAANKRPIGLDVGKIRISDDFDSPLPNIENEFY